MFRLTTTVHARYKTKQHKELQMQFSISKLTHKRNESNYGTRRVPSSTDGAQVFIKRIKIVGGMKHRPYHYVRRVLNIWKGSRGKYLEQVFHILYVGQVQHSILNWNWFECVLYNVVSNLFILKVINNNIIYLFICYLLLLVTTKHNSV